jgi:hypothetical protein
MTAVLARGAVDLYWIPLGAGDHVVLWVGSCTRRSRPRRAPTALRPLPFRPGGGRPRRPIRDRIRADPGRAGTSAASSSRSGRDEMGGRFRLFRYEIRRWREGSIPDANYAVSSPIRVASDLARAQRVLDLVPSVPIPVWGRDELRTGEMWNSNSVVSWLLARAGVDRTAQPPPGGRAPGWDAGLTVATRGAR